MGICQNEHKKDLTMGKFQGNKYKNIKMEIEGSRWRSHLKSEGRRRKKIEALLGRSVRGIKCVKKNIHTTLGKRIRWTMEKQPSLLSIPLHSHFFNTANWGVNESSLTC